MKRNAKKGFTLVELVIVIAVIAILAAVLIPTFGGIIEKANKSAFEQNAANAYKADLAEALADDGVVKDDEGEKGEFKDVVVGTSWKYEFKDTTKNWTATFDSTTGKWTYSYNASQGGGAGQQETPTEPTGN